MSSAFQRSGFFGVHFTINTGRTSHCLSRAPFPSLHAATLGRRRLGALGLTPDPSSGRSNELQAAATSPWLGAFHILSFPDHASDPTTGVGTVHGGLLNLFLIRCRLATRVVGRRAGTVTASSVIPSPRPRGSLPLTGSGSHLTAILVRAPLVRTCNAHCRAAYKGPSGRFHGAGPPRTTPGIHAQHPTFGADVRAKVILPLPFGRAPLGCIAAAAR